MMKRLPCWWIPIEGSRPRLRKRTSFFISFLMFCEKRAVSKGLEIDERFRNFNGMKFQYELLRYLMTDGEQGLSGNIAKTIAEVAELYRSEPEKFEEILNRID